MQPIALERNLPKQHRWAIPRCPTNDPQTPALRPRSRPRRELTDRSAHSDQRSPIQERRHCRHSRGASIWESRTNSTTNSAMTRCRTVFRPGHRRGEIDPTALIISLHCSKHRPARRVVRYNSLTARFAWRRFTGLKTQSPQRPPCRLWLV